MFRQYSKARSRTGRDTVEQVADDVVHQPLSFRVVQDVADQCAWLAPVVVLRMKAVGAAHQLPVGVPSGRLAVPVGVRLRPPLGVGAYTGSERW